MKQSEHSTSSQSSLSEEAALATEAEVKLLQYETLVRSGIGEMQGMLRAHPELEAWEQLNIQAMLACNRDYGMKERLAEYHRAQPRGLCGGRTIRCALMMLSALVQAWGEAKKVAHLHLGSLLQTAFASEDFERTRQRVVKLVSEQMEAPALVENLQAAQTPDELIQRLCRAAEPLQHAAEAALARELPDAEMRAYYARWYQARMLMEYWQRYRQNLMARFLPLEKQLERESVEISEIVSRLPPLSEARVRLVDAVKRINQSLPGAASR